MWKRLKKWDATFTEWRTKAVEVEANSEEEAVAIVEKQYYDEKISLDKDFTLQMNFMLEESEE